jgi:hypothetical protein
MILRGKDDKKENMTWYMNFYQAGVAVPNGYLI